MDQKSERRKYWNRKVKIELKKKREVIISSSSDSDSDSDNEENTRQKRRISEFEANYFSKFYKNPPKITEIAPKVVKNPVEKELSSYKHQDAINFAAETWIWKKKRILDSEARKLPRQPFQNPSKLAAFPKDPNPIKAYYRLIADNDDKYIFIACHVNVHGFHRADLRFVEVNDRTIVKGLEGKSVMGQLFLGDVVAVTELRWNSKNSGTKLNIQRVHQDTPCHWEVSKMTLLTRKIDNGVVFAFLADLRTAVAKGFNEAFEVRNEAPNKQKIMVDMLYSGRTFIPEHIQWNFTQDLGNSKYYVHSKACQLPYYPSSSGTIFKFSMLSSESIEFLTGVRAFSESVVESPESVVETCALMGYSAADTVFNGRFDCRAFRMINPTRDGQIVRFGIANPWRNPTNGKWMTKNKIEFSGRQKEKFLKIKAEIETVVADPETRQLQITARMSRCTPKLLHFKDNLFVVSQRKALDYKLLKDDFFKHLGDKTNGKTIIKALYGGKKLEFEGVLISDKEFIFPDNKNPVILNKFQSEYVQMILARTPMVLGSSPFGCGKSMTIVTAAMEMWKVISSDKKERYHKKQLLITQSNYASVNLIDIAKKCSGERVKFVRFVTESNWKELHDNCRTDYDLPSLIRSVFKQYALSPYHDFSMQRMTTVVRFLINEHVLEPHELGGSAKIAYQCMLGNEKDKDRRFGSIGKQEIEVFFEIYKPDIIMITADSLQGLISSRVLKARDVITIQIDEASQVPEYMIFNLLATFPHANFGLIGDIHQLPPYCTEELTGKLKDYGIGNTMERAVRGSLFPKAVLRYVYRCHPVTTRLLSDLFYEGDLISGVTEDMRNEFMLKMPRSFWPNPAYPMIIVNNQEAGYRMGMSSGNKMEAVIVKQIVEFITGRSGYSIPAKDVGVISFYSAQTSVLTEQLRGSGVKCGTVDSFQGSEREVIILCLTNEKLTDFMQLSNRLNVAMSRARQSTIVIGNVDGMSKANYWSTVVQRAQEHGCIVDTKKYPFCDPNGKTPEVQLFETDKRADEESVEDIISRLNKLEVARKRKNGLPWWLDESD